MAKEITAKIKLQCPGGQATPAPPVGPALGQHGVNIGQFVQQFNAATADKPGLIIPVEITVFKDRTFHDSSPSRRPRPFCSRRPPVLDSGSKEPGREIVAGSVTWAQVARSRR